ncbi:hypothetical protein PIB30_068204 [Stylosanthes scabra]|uniref:Uncharacterized protein n=1 Tax=Stylosanthes scabra TaxID=79078 RepID=A0ABU6RMT6_9FABA|nr:hypothetical protein [Stylosanthes scabra]
MGLLHQHSRSPSRLAAPSPLEIHTGGATRTSLGRVHAIDPENLELELVRRKKIQQPIGHSSNWHCADSPNVAQNDALQLLQRIDGLHLKHNRTYGPKPNPVRIPAHLTIRI